jgi:hypothetical protein
MCQGPENRWTSDSESEPEQYLLLGSSLESADVVVKPAKLSLIPESAKRSRSIYWLSHGYTDLSLRKANEAASLLSPTDLTPRRSEAVSAGCQKYLSLIQGHWRVPISEALDPLKLPPLNKRGTHRRAPRLLKLLFAICKNCTPSEARGHLERAIKERPMRRSRSLYVEARDLERALVYLGKERVGQRDLGVKGQECD